MYNLYGSGVYKKYQVNMGKPYQIRPKKTVPVPEKKEQPDLKTRNPEEEAEAVINAARAEAEKIINDAMNKANDMLEEAKEKVEQHMFNVEQKAKEEGYRNGEQLARQHYQALLDEAEDIKKQAQKVYNDTIAGLESDIIDIIIDVSRKIIGMELEHNRDAVISLVGTAITGSSPSNGVVVRVCPEDYDYVSEKKDELLRYSENIHEITIKKDNALNKGDCLIETGYGSIDASAETQLSAVEQAFRELLGYKPSDGEIRAEE
ncbi:MAG: flagellar assembly protein FliH [Clostridiaceae bacterium]|nr:flagellar assembly protein FliH [Clostridiaceae bacterium]